jgi:anti-sigma factor RsiW
MPDEGRTDDAPADVPITPELLADLQAGALDDETAARLWRRLRTDPAAAATLAALDRVRRDLAHLGGDDASASGVPAAVTAGVTAALRAAPPRPRPGC